VAAEREVVELEFLVHGSVQKLLLIQELENRRQRRGVSVAQQNGQARFVDQHELAGIVGPRRRRDRCRR
jgi:hypothetical protein